MKNYMKKLLAGLCTASVAAMIMTTAAFGAEGIRPEPGTADSQAYTTSTGDQAVTGTEGAEGQTITTNPATGTTSTSNIVTNNGAANNVTSNTSEAATNKKYQTKLGGFLWFLLSVIVNFILSCWVGSRFYQMAVRNTQGSREIRALRKDIEEKFAGTLKGISEPAMEIINQNENYARSDEGIEMPDKRSHIELSEEELEMMKKWDSKRASAKKNAAEGDEDENDDTRRVIDRGSYRPTRRSSGIEFEDEDAENYEDYEDYDEDGYNERLSQRKRPSKMVSTGAAAKRTAEKATGKAKKFLNNVFPFNE